MSRTHFGQVFIASHPNRSLLGAGTLKGNRLLPFLIALILLAFALGSLPRTQPGGSLLLNSDWLIYILSLAPVIGLGLIIMLIILLVYNSRLISDSLGYGIARKRGTKKKGSKVPQLIISLAAWAIAIEILIFRCGGIFCSKPQLDLNGTSSITNSVSGNQTATILPLLGVAYQFSSLVQTNWFYAAFLGLLVVTSVIFVRGIIVSWEETRAELRRQIPTASAEAITSVEDAFRILKAQPEADPRTRIINSYQCMIQAAQRLGASITSDQTARELEAAIRMMLGIRGSSIRELTGLFEEARYSLHAITEYDAEQAQQCLLSIAEEMGITLSV